MTLRDASGRTTRQIMDEDGLSYVAACRVARGGPAHPPDGRKRTRPENATRRAVREALEAEPDLFASEVAKRLGISRQAVSLHVKALGLNPGHAVSRVRSATGEKLADVAARLGITEAAARRRIAKNSGLDHVGLMPCGTPHVPELGGRTIAEAACAAGVARHTMNLRLRRARAGDLLAPIDGPPRRGGPHRARCNGCGARIPGVLARDCGPDTITLCPKCSKAPGEGTT